MLPEVSVAQVEPVTCGGRIRGRSLPYRDQSPPWSCTRCSQNHRRKLRPWTEGMSIVIGHGVVGGCNIAVIICYGERHHRQHKASSLAGAASSSRVPIAIDTGDTLLEGFSLRLGHAKPKATENTTRRHQITVVVGGIVLRRDSTCELRLTALASDNSKRETSFGCGDSLQSSSGAMDICILLCEDPSSEV
jgi:hypothetical protein